MAEFPNDAEEQFEKAHDALDRMRRAQQRGTGCHLTAAMIQDLHLTFLGAVWEEERPTPSEWGDG